MNSHHIPVILVQPNLTQESTQKLTRKKLKKYKEPDLTNVIAKPYYECEHCLRKLATEKGLQKHRCETMKRLDHVNTEDGKRAFVSYNYYRKQKGYSTVGVNTFIESRDYKAFCRFIDFVIEYNIPNTAVYIEFAVINKSPVMDWNKTSVYRKYLQYLDTKDSATRTTDSIKSLNKIVLEINKELNANIGIKEVIQTLTLDDLKKLILNKQISLWFVFLCSHVINRIRTYTTDEVNQFKLAVNYDFWRNKIVNDRKGVIKAKEILMMYRLI